MEIISQILQVLPMFFVFGYVLAAVRTKDDIKEIKYLLWAGFFLLATLTDAII